MPVKAPFRFARINRWIYEPAWANLVSHDVPFADGLSGEAEVEITAASSILVGGDRRKASAHQAGEVRPFQLPGGGYAIPGSALQGMARAILEVAGFGRLGPWVQDRKFGIRDLSGTATAREHYQNRLSANNGGHVTVHSKAGWLMKGVDDKPHIVPCRYARIHLDDVWHFKQALLKSSDPPKPSDLYDRKNSKDRYHWFMNRLSGGMSTLDADFAIDKPKYHQHNRRRITIQYSRCRHAAKSKGTPGTLVLTGKPQSSIRNHEIDLRSGHKKLEFVFHSPCRNGATTTGTTGALRVHDDVWDAFLFMHEEQPGREINPNWDFWKSEFEKGNPVPVFYWVDGGQVTTLGTAFAFKAAHRKSARDLLGHSHPGHLDPVESMKLDLAHLLFGVAAEHDGGRGLKRRARFGLALADGDPQPCAPRNPSILLGPKPTYYGLYVRQRQGDTPVPRGDPMATYTPLDRPGEPHLHRPELSGVKIWPARGPGRFNPGRVPSELAGNRKVQTTLVTLPPGTVFRSRLTFHNLRPVELGALLWALSYGEEAAFGDSANHITKRHRLGMGKPLGLGEVAIRVTELETEPTGSTSGAAAQIAATDLVRTFEEHMESDVAYGSDWRNSKQVKALLKAADPTKNTAEHLEYMTLDDYRNAKGGAEYLPDYVKCDSHERSVPTVSATASGGQSCAWVDETIASLMAKHHENDELKILRGQPLARAWKELSDPALKEEALRDIKARWNAKGWWDDPSGRAARRAKQIYEGDGTAE